MSSVVVWHGVDGVVNVMSVWSRSCRDIALPIHRRRRYATLHCTIPPMVSSNSPLSAGCVASCHVVLFSVAQLCSVVCSGMSCRLVSSYVMCDMPRCDMVSNFSCLTSCVVCRHPTEQHKHRSTLHIGNTYSPRAWHDDETRDAG